VHIVPFARDLGVSATKAAGVLSTIGGVSMLGRFATGLFIDRFNSRLAMIFCFVLLIFTLLWLQIADKLWMIYLFAACYGAFWRYCVQWVFWWICRSYFGGTYLRCHWQLQSGFLAQHVYCTPGIRFHSVTQTHSEMR
jgi:predicted MFS family arabinose efflux permease